MKFAVASLLATLVASVSATPAFTNSNFNVTAGAPFTLTWTNATGPVTIVLKTGSPDDLKTVETIDSADSSDSFTWSVPTTLAPGNYAFSISDSTGVNYSKLFPLSGSGTASSSAASSASASSTSSSAESSSSSSSTKSSSSHTTTSSSAHSTSTSSNSTTSTSTKTTSTSTKSTASATSTPVNTNNGPQAKSPLAFVLVTVAALLYFN